jgi:hypothetical protein
MYEMVGGDAAYHGWTSKCAESHCRIKSSDACVITPQQISDTSIEELLSGLDKESVLQGSTNPRWRGKVLRIRAPIYDGFFVRALFAMTTAKWAAANRIPFFVDLEEVNYDPVKGLGENSDGATVDAYYDPSAPGDRWEQYFEPVAGIDKKQVYKKIPNNKVIELDGNTAWYYYIAGDAMALYPTTFAEAVRERKRRASEVAAWIHPKDEILEAAGSQWSQVKPESLLQEASTPQERNTVVLGVHLRGTDKFLAGGKIEPQHYWPFIDRYIKHHEPSANVRLFLASDDDTYMQSARDRYGDRVYHQAHVPRASGNHAIWKAFDRSTAHTKGKSAIMDTLMLAKCDFLLKSASAVSEFAIYFNPKLIHNSIDLSISDNPLPVWAEGLTIPKRKDLS